MDVVKLLSRLKESGVRVREEGGRLRVRAAKGVLSEELRAVLSAHKEELLRFLQEASTTSRGEGLPLERVSRQDPLPLSYSQSRLWFLEQFEPGTAAFNLPEAVDASGPLDTVAFCRSLREVIFRHEALRTTFEAVDGEPRQVIAERPPLPLVRVDLRGLPAGRRQGEALSAARREAVKAFDISRGPLVRLTLFHLASEHHLFLVNIHHIVFDRWSMGVFLDELKASYTAQVTGDGDGRLPPLRFQYADFAAWQKRRLAGEPFERLVAFWRRQLDGAPPVLKLPTDRPRPPVRSERGAKIPVRFPPALCKGLEALSTRQSTTPFVVLTALAKTLLYRYTGQEDLSTGTFIANRNHSEIERLIGFFVNTLVLRTDLAGRPAFLELVERVQRVALEAYRHQDLPFEKLLEELRVEREMSVSPLFQVMLVFQNTPSSTLELPGLSIRRQPLPLPVWANFDWTLWLWKEDDSIEGFVDYKKGLFDASTLRRLLAHFETLLEAVVESPSSSIAELPLLGPSERHQVLTAWNDTAWNDTVARRPRGLLVHQLFEAQAERDGDAVAVVFEGRELTYRELNVRANRLARWLRRRGAGPETVVAVLAERGLEMVTAALAVLKAGAAYLPLDTTHARERLAYLVEVSQAALLLTTESVASEPLPELPCEVTVVDPLLADGSAEAENLPPRGGPANLAYVVYTSGSTGRPKGVMVTHGGLVNAYLAWETSYRLREEARCHLQMASFSFDVFAGDMWRALGSGARLVICPREVLLTPPELYALMRRQKVDSAEFVPAVARHLMQHLEETGERLDFLRLLVVGSDVWYVWEYRKLRNLAGPSTRCISSYGLSEVTIDSSYFEGATTRWSADAQVPIGRPFAGTRLLILDAGLERVPIAVPGELCLGGPGLGRGYVRQPATTAAAFVPDPLAGEPAAREAGARLYRTGDQARHLADGNVEFLGRIDTQVKIRGFRVEPSEVEAVLGEHPGIDEAVVVARDDLPGGLGLVAYVVAHAGEEEATGPEKLRRFLKAHVADYMVPYVFVALDELPLNNSGKVDRRRLPKPAVEDVSPGRYTAPSTPIEEALATIFEEVVGVERVSADGHFFEIGGTSLVATQVVSRLRDTFEIELPLRSLFEAPVVAELALLVEERLLARIEELSDAEAKALL